MNTKRTERAEVQFAGRQRNTTALDSDSAKAISQAQLWSGRLCLRLCLIARAVALATIKYGEQGFGLDRFDAPFLPRPLAAAMHQDFYK